MGFKKIHRISSEALWVFIGHATAFLGAVIGVRIMTEFLDPSAYGELSLGLTIATLVNQTILGPLGNGASRFYTLANQKNDLLMYFYALKELFLAALFLVSILFLIFTWALYFLNHSSFIPILISSILFSIASGINSIFVGIQNAARQRRFVAFCQGIDPWIRILFAVMFFVIFTNRADIAMYGFTFATVLLVAAQVYKLKMGSLDGGYEKSNQWRFQIWKYSWPFCAWGIFTWLQLASDRWALEYAGSDGDVGLYVVLYQLGFYPISVMTGLMTQFLSPILFERVSENNLKQEIKGVNDFIRRLVLIALLLTLVCSGLAFKWHLEIFEIVVAKEYYSVSYLLPWMILAGGIFGAGQVVALNLMTLQQTVPMLMPKIVTALVGLIMNLIGAVYFGIAGVVAGGVIFSVLYFLWMTWLLSITRLDDRLIAFQNK